MVLQHQPPPLRPGKPFSQGGILVPRKKGRPWMNSRPGICKPA